MAKQEENSDNEKFMASEYEQLHTYLRDEIRKGEERVNFFLSITSIASAGLVFFAQNTAISPEIKYSFSMGVLIVVLIYGLMTLNRLNARVVQARVYNKLLSEIHKYFARRDSEIQAYVKVVEKSFGIPKNKTIGIQILGLLRGTLQDFIIVTNALMCGGIALVFLLNKGLHPNQSIIWSIFTVIVSATILYTYHFIMKEKLPPFE
jgi:hypothetical protein